MEAVGGIAFDSQGFMGRQAPDDADGVEYAEPGGRIFAYCPSAPRTDDGCAHRKPTFRDRGWPRTNSLTLWVAAQLIKRKVADCPVPATGEERMVQSRCLRMISAIFSGPWPKTKWVR